MNKIILKAALLLGAALAFPMSANAALVGRDINGGAVTARDGSGLLDASAVFLYDDVLKVTWLRDANANGPMNWTTADTWAKSLNNNAAYGNLTGWRLPTMIADPNTTLSFAGGTDYGFNVRTTSGSTVYSEMASLWYDTLGNKAYCNPVGSTGFSCSGPQDGWGLKNTGDFQNLQSGDYWSDLEYEPNARVWFFHTLTGYQSNYGKSASLYALAVRYGDVLDPAPAAVPLPAAVWLMLSGIGALGVAARRRKSA